VKRSYSSLLVISYAVASLEQIDVISLEIMAVNTSSASIEPTSQPDESPSGNFTLENILGTNHEAVEHPRLKEKDSGDATGPGEGWDEESAVRPAADGFCVECEGVWLI
jgi:hypothetical protein